MSCTEQSTNSSKSIVWVRNVKVEGRIQGGYTPHDVKNPNYYDNRFANHNLIEIYELSDDIT